MSKNLSWELRRDGPHFIATPDSRTVYRMWQNGRKTYQLYDPNSDPNASVYGETFENAEAAAQEAQSRYDKLVEGRSAE